ncbi:hypothetical protein Q1695_008909 [Nippostrongylus brasiliensis]|nr:hypothetical protein Q1695_008909 [Nippostrongylus brasiliensis]
MDSVQYQRVLKSRLVPFLEGRRKQTHVLQQDNAAVHVSRSTTDWLQRNRIQTMDWPVCSPDCNHMESMWRIVVRQVYADNKQFSSVEELKRAVVTAWDNVSDEVIRNFVGSMRNRVIDVIRENGGPIDY